MGKRIGNLNLVNYKDHPTNGLYKILNFNSVEESNLFEEKLTEKGLFFEKDTELHKGDLLYLFAVKNRDFDKVQRINFEVSAVFRSPIIKSKSGRYFLVGFFFLIMTVALIGYFKSNG